MPLCHLIFSRYGLPLLDLLFQQPVVNVQAIEKGLSVTFKTASKLVCQFEQCGLLQEVTRGKRNRRFHYRPYLALFQDQG